jgi:hypothetical protein
MPRRRTARNQEHSERGLSAERRRALVERHGPATLRAMGLYRRISGNQRAPLGTPTGVALPSQQHRPGTRLHGSRHMAALNAYNRRAALMRTIRQRSIAPQRAPANGEFNYNRAVEATPFQHEVELEAEYGGRPRRERLNQLPIALPVQGATDMIERVQHEGPETNLYLPWEMHGPALQARRNRSRSRTSRRKGRPRSRSQPRRNRSTSM